MKNINFLIIACVTFLCSCGDMSKKTSAGNADTLASMKMASGANMVTDAIDSTHTGSNWKGTYIGMLPCTDCDGVEIALMLHGDNTYMLSKKYNHSKSHTNTDTEGKFKWLDARTIQLEGAKDDSAKYLVGVNALTQLGADGKKMTGDAADKYKLVKK